MLQRFAAALNWDRSMSRVALISMSIVRMGCKCLNTWFRLSKVWGSKCNTSGLSDLVAMLMLPLLESSYLFFVNGKCFGYGTIGSTKNRWYGYVCHDSENPSQSSKMLLGTTIHSLNPWASLMRVFSVDATCLTAYLECYGSCNPLGLSWPTESTLSEPFVTNTSTNDSQR